MNSIRNGLGMRKAGNRGRSGQLESPHSNAVFTQVHNTLYLGGNFTKVGGVPRDRLAAIDATTGALTDWNPGADGPVYALAVSPDGSRIYAGGAFLKVGGVDHRRLAAIGAATGAVDQDWNPSADAPVRTLETSGGYVYAGGEFLKVNGEARLRLAALAATGGGDLVRSWRASANGPVRKLDVVGPRLYVGGYFTSINGQLRRNLGAIKPYSGGGIAWRPANKGRPVLDFVASGTRVYTAEGGRGGAVASYRVGTGALAWIRGGDGDVQTITTLGGRLYVGGHFDSLARESRGKLAAFFPKTGKLDPSWTPRVNQGVWDLTPDGLTGRLYAGGDFSLVNGRPQMGLTRFSPKKR